jgi:aspartate aminotransferase
VEPSVKAAQVAPSPTMAIDARAKELTASGVDVVNFGAGEPDFDTPVHIRDAGMSALASGRTRYTPAAGLPELRQAVARYVLDRLGISYKPQQVVISVGAKHSIFNALLSLVNPDDGVLLPVPYWVSYPEQIRLAGGQVVPVPLAAEAGFRLTRAALEQAFRPGVRGLILNSPSNPTGAVVPPEETQAIAEFIHAHDLWVISDEIYDRLLYGDVQHRSIVTYPGMVERTVYVNGFSKAYAMTGWRLGYACAPASVASAMDRIQSQMTSNPTTFAQVGGVAALQGPQEVVEEMRQAFAARRTLALAMAAELPRITAVPPDGAFYLWLEAGGWIGRTVAGAAISNTDDLARVILEQARVAVVPGSGFGRPEGLRLSFATSEARIEEGLSRMAALLKA